ncbi:hypothetical protein GTQ99_00530 [Kineococcus sp. T13]|uniref:hypothetical protein n=1 Tax=Kineococcus vitellinus TaxID=2696565 RepID=UPI001412E9D6|nr:hypothetical protein [Kineococcus vitellinus]NAZ73917.1 hypothetical protein [Kineococcus vitellinus]
MLDLDDPVEQALAQALTFHRVNRADLKDAHNDIEDVKEALALPNARPEQHIEAVHAAIFGA